MESRLLIYENRAAGVYVDIHEYTLRGKGENLLPSHINNILPIERSVC